MGSFSIWHWIILLVVLSSPVLPIFFANETKILARKSYAIRMIPLIIIGALMSEVMVYVEPTLAAVLVLLVSLVMSVLGILWSVHRNQDIGVSKWWCLLLMIPFVNIVFILVLLFTRGQSSAEAGIPSNDSISSGNT